MSAVTIDEAWPGFGRAFTVAELQQHAAFWTSSLSGIVPIRSVDGVALPRRDDDVAELTHALSPRGNRVAARGIRWVD